MTDASSGLTVERISVLCNTFEAAQLAAPTAEGAGLLRHLRMLRDCPACAEGNTEHGHGPEVAELRRHLALLDAGSLGSDEARAVRRLISDDAVAAVLTRAMARSGAERPSPTGRRKAGGADADFDAFVRERYTELLHYAVVLTGRRGDAEEIVQEALLRCLARWRKVPAQHAVAYARKAIYHEFIRTARHRRPVPPETIDGEAGSADFSAGVGERWHVLDVLQQLPARQRAAVVCRVFLDMTEAQAARELGCAVGTVKSLTSRGLARVRELWQGEAEVAGQAVG
jgi:RNA polymerase sigma-70 factor (sigma-E family)